MSAPKRHHYNPVLHLRNFVGNAPPGQIWSYDKLGGAPRSGAPENTAVESGFYAVEKDDGTKDLRIEDFLASAENKAAPIYKDLLSGRLPEGQAKADLAFFLALQYVRTPTMRRLGGQTFGQFMQIHSYASAIGPEAFARLMDRYEGDTGNVQTTEERAELREAMLNPDRFEMQISKEVTMRNFGIADRLVKIFFRMSWMTLTPKSGYFITSDNPLTRRVDGRTVHPVVGDGGFLNKTAEVSYPLSPGRTLVMMWPDFPVASAQCERGYVDDLNAARAANAERFLYSHIKDQRVARLASRFKKVRPQMRISGFGPKRFARVSVPRRMT